MATEVGKPRPRLLFVSPTLPDTSGNGLAMRAAQFIEALSVTHDVSLLVVPLFADSPPATNAFVEERCERVVVASRGPEPGWWERVRSRSGGLPRLARLAAAYAPSATAALERLTFDAVHAFRLYTGPLALDLARRHRSTVHLDVDDVESTTHARLADLYRLNGHLDEAGAAAVEARRYEEIERRILPMCQRVYVCSHLDAGRVGPLVGADLRIVPNTIRIPEKPVEPLTTHPFTFLFVGTLDYYPNQDGIAYFCREILPEVRKRTDRPCLVRIVGRGEARAIAGLAAVEGVRIAGEVKNLEREYADADAVIVPLRAGGGTRIKVLEAFAYRRPVISTSLGMEGIDALPGQHYLQGDSARSFASQCLHLMQDPERGRTLAASAYELVTQRYAPSVVAKAIAGPP